MHKNSLRIMETLLDRHAPKSGLCVDVGSYDVNGCYRPMVERRGLSYFGVDIAVGPNVDEVIEPYGIGKKTRQFWDDHLPDLVISGQCLEHTTRPWDWIRDICTILSEDVPLILIAPAMWPQHRYPVDCWRILPDGMRSLMEFAGLEVLEVGLSKIDERHEDCWGVGRRAGCQ